MIASGVLWIRRKGGKGLWGGGRLYINFARGGQQKKVATFFGSPRVVESGSGEQAGIEGAE